MRLHVYFKKVKAGPDPAGRPVVLSEFGGYSYGAPGHTVSPRLFGYRRFDAPERFLAAYRGLIEKEVAPLTGVLSAAVYTQLSDVEDEVNGLLSYDRRCCKADPAALREINEKLRL